FHHRRQTITLVALNLNRPVLDRPAGAAPLLERGGEFQQPGFIEGRSDTVVTPLPRLPFVSRPRRTTGALVLTTSFFAGGADVSVAFSWASRRLPPPIRRAARSMTSRSIRASTSGASSTCQNSTFSAQAGKRSCSKGRCSASLRRRPNPLFRD